MSTLAEALTDPDPSVRLNAVLAAGIRPSASDLDTLVAQCATEPDFQVREMLTWALIRQPAELVVPRLLAELTRPEAQGRSQALHTLSKLHDGAAWPAVAARLDDPDAGVMRTAWYAAVALAPETERLWLAEKLATRLGHGDPDTQMSLSRALVALGPETIAPILAAASAHGNEATQRHVEATRKLLEDPDYAFTHSQAHAHREVALGRTRSAKG